MQDNEGECPICYFIIKIKKDTIEHEVITCEDCGSDLEVFSIKPKVILKEAEKLKEDHGE